MNLFSLTQVSEYETRSTRFINQVLGQTPDRVVPS